MSHVDAKSFKGQLIHHSSQCRHRRQNALRNKPYLWLLFPLLFFFCPSSEVYAIPGTQFGIVPEHTLDIQRQLSNTDTAIHSLSCSNFVPESSLPPLTTTAFSAPASS